MSDCHNLFTEFNSIVRLNESKRKSLKKSRKSLREKIRKYFREEKEEEISPKFHGQGSFIVDTIVEPIPEVTEEKTLLYYDIDDGIYFIGKKSDRKSVQTYHNWIIDAVDGHTNTPPVDKNTCVRVLFADGHHIDLPIYFKEDGSTPELAHRAKGWIESDPKAFQEWFENKVKDAPQLRRIVRFLKAWSNYRETQRADKTMVSGFILTILAANNYISNKRDDIAFKETLVMIKATLDTSFTCYRPTVPANEDLLSSYNHKDYFMKCLNDLIDSAKEALTEPNQKKACEKWQSHFGDRFPCSLAKDEDDSENLSKSFIATASSSRPWVNEPSYE